MLDLENIVRDDLAKNGFTAPQIQADGKIHRFKRYSNDKNPDAWYVCFTNHENGQDFLAGAYGDWSDGSEHSFCTHISLSSEKKKSIFKKVEKSFDLEQVKRWEECSKDSEAIWKNFTVSEGLHAYLVRKKIANLYGARLSRDQKNLIIPVMDLKEKLWGFQVIDSEGKKKFQPGTKKKGNFYPLGEIDPFDTLYLCEGFATGCSIHQAIDKTVLVCFDANNLVEVARVVRAAYPEIILIICGDNDVFTEGNPGKTKAEEAARIGMGSVVLPSFASLETQPTDFNDLVNLEGRDKIRALILGERGRKFYLKCLGFKGQTYFYTSSDNLQISEIQAHSEIELLKLMPKDYWLSKYGNDKGAIDWLLAKSDLTANCRARGIFTKKDVRGHGVWVDQGKVIVHLGDRLYYDGEDHHIHSVMNQYVYEFEESLPPIHSHPLEDEELAPFLELINNLNYTHKQQALFLGGWMGLSGICGALKWRPHLWLTGEAGSGKSTVKELVDSYLAHAFKRLSVVGATTEAGIRQAIKAASIPVIFDEFEPENRQSAERVQICLELMRQASSENSSAILKGSADGDSISYYARFAALVCSVKPRLVAEADRSRFTYIHLERDQHSTPQWAKVRRLLDVMSPEYCKRFFARMVKLIPVIVENKEVLQRAFVDQGQSQRLGQQYGSLLAGFVALTRQTVLTDKEANSLVSIIQLEEEGTLDSDRDQDEALQYMLNKKFHANQLDLTIRGWMSRSKDDLKLLGMKPTEEGIFIYKNNPQLSQLFMDSKWGESWYVVLARVKGVHKKRLRIAGGRAYWGIVIPTDLIHQDSEV